MKEVTTKDGRTVLFVSHNMGAVRSLCTKCILLDGGRVHSMGDTDKIIGDYMLVNSVASTVEFESKHHVRGNGSATVTKASITGFNDHPSNSFLVNEKITLSVDYDVKDASKDLSFWVIFFDNEGNPVVSSFQKDTGEPIKPKLGRDNIKIEINEPGLTPGRYTVSLGIISHDGPLCNDYADWVDNCFVVDIAGEFVNGRHFDSRLGKVNKQAIWHINN